MTSPSEPAEQVWTLEHVLSHFRTRVPAPVLEALRLALVAREDAMADVLRLAGQQFGLYPQIVAEVFAEVGLGTPVTSGERALIRSNFLALMEQLRNNQNEGGQG